MGVAVQADTWLRVSQICKLLGVSDRKVRSLIEDGALPAVRHGERGMYLIRESAFNAYLASRESPTATTAAA